ncbi:unnamed protein product [Lampetra planeri]
MDAMNVQRPLRSSSISGGRAPRRLREQRPQSVWLLSGRAARHGVSVGLGPGEEAAGWFRGGCPANPTEVSAPCRREQDAFESTSTVETERWIAQLKCSICWMESHIVGWREMAASRGGGFHPGED